MRQKFNKQAKGFTKDVKPFIKAINKAGWRTRFGRGSHLIVYPPNGGIVVISYTASDRRAIAAIRRDLREAGLPGV